MLTSNEIATLFETFLGRLEYSKPPVNLYAPIKYVLSNGGKRLRPTLLALAYNMYCDDSLVERSFDAAAGIEIFHNFTLLHDDLMDKASVRRGNPTVHCKWNENTAILSGDGMLVLAYRQLVQAAGDRLSEVMAIANGTFTEIMEGQQYDMDFETRSDVTEQEYIEMIRLKTSVLLGAAVRLGAVLGGASEEDASLLYSFGEKLGLAFQLQDDLLDVYGDPAVFGKRIGGDILCNKKTYMYINAYRLASSEQKKELDRWAMYDGNDPDAKIAAVTGIYNAVGVRQLASDMISNFFSQALALLDRVSVPENGKTELKRYAYSLLDRKQ